MKPRKPDETDAHYISRLEAQNRSLKNENKRLSKWSSRIDRAIGILSSDISLALQALAERAKVRSHPSVTTTVRILDGLVGLVWKRDDTPDPELTLPKDWDLDPPEVWSGDADMGLNSPIASAIELLNMYAVAEPNLIPEINDAVEKLEKVIDRGLEGVKREHGRWPIREPQAPPKHYRELSKEQLETLVGTLGWKLLDMAQDMSFANEMLRRDLRAGEYRRIGRELYKLSRLHFADEEYYAGIKVLGNVEAE